jgi:hypothetical protein
MSSESLRLQDIVLLIEQYPELSLRQVQQFISLATKLKDDILLAQPSSVLAHNPPDVLPPTVLLFLQNSCHITLACVETCWDVLKAMIWHEVHGLEDSVLHDFVVHGHSLGLCAFMFHTTTSQNSKFIIIIIQFLVLCILLIIPVPVQAVLMGEVGSY